MEPAWTSLIAKYWGGCLWLRNQTDVDESATELREFFGRNTPDNSELCAVIRWLAGSEGKQDKCPTLRELIRAVCIRRKAARQESEGYATGENVVADTKAAMVRSKSWRERWNILCQGSFYGGIERDLDSEETLAVDSWARVHFGAEWDKHTTAIKQAMGRGIREVIERLWPDAKPGRMLTTGNERSAEE